MSHLTKSNEAFWWSLFSAGGVMAALFVPVMVLVTGLVLPFLGTGDPEARYIQAMSLVSSWLVRIVLFVVIFLSFFHCAHRIRHVLMDLGLRRAGTVLMICCYSGALAGTVAAGFLLARL